MPNAANVLQPRELPREHIMILDMLKKPIRVGDTVITYQQRALLICKVINLHKGRHNLIYVRPVGNVHSSFTRHAGQCTVVNEQIISNNQNYPEYAL
tara:strand:- start:184 stop:474 length:291 start_codon:yes stop_codon:yes gene_type:complete